MNDNRKLKLIALCGLLLAAALTSFVTSDGDRSFPVLNDSLRVGATHNVKAGTGRAQGVQVYVTGEVRCPGIYVLAAGSRGLEAVEKAGGFTELADRERVNLSRILRDGAQLNVPTLGKQKRRKPFLVGVDKMQQQRSFRRPSRGGTESGFVQGRVNSVFAGVRLCVNSASAEELQSLPGLYGELARRIVLRRKERPFLAFEDLLEVQGMNSKILQGIRDFVEL